MVNLLIVILVVSNIQVVCFVCDVRTIETKKGIGYGHPDIHYDVAPNEHRPYLCILTFVDSQFESYTKKVSHFSSLPSEFKVNRKSGSIYSRIFSNLFISMVGNKRHNRGKLFRI